MKRKSEAGQAIAAVAIGLVFLIGAVGLAIDMGYMRFEKRRMQSAADSAAIAGASELQYLNGDYAAAAQNDSKANGFEEGVNGVTVTPNNPPIDAPFAGRANYVEVKVQQNVPTFFMRIFGVNSTSLSATAVADSGTSRNCVYNLDQVGMSGGNNLNPTTCGIVDNHVLATGGGAIASDPLGYLVPPMVPACTSLIPFVVDSPIPTTLTPGVYCGGIQIAATNTGTVTFLPNPSSPGLPPGVYVLKDGGIQISGPSNVNGSGVTFFVTGSASVQILGSGNISLSAPQSDLAPALPAGILFFQDRADTQAATIVGGGQSLTGTLYFPSAQLTLGANSATPYLVLVAQSLQIQGNVTIGTDYSSLPHGSPVKAAFLVQ